MSRLSCKSLTFSFLFTYLHSLSQLVVSVSVSVLFGEGPHHSLVKFQCFTNAKDGWDIIIIKGRKQKRRYNSLPLCGRFFEEQMIF